MAKRGATSDINHDNWDEPYEAEEAGSFKTASDNALQKRVIKIAKRRVKPSENSESGTSVFASFTGFKAAPVSTASTTSFAFLGSNSVAPTTNGTMSVTASTAKTEITPQQKYWGELQNLNRSVSEWIKTHVDSDPVCILTPVFKDYEMHLKKIQETRDANEKSKLVVASTPPSSVGSFSFVSSSTTENKYPINILTTATPTGTTSETGASASLADTNKPSLSIFGETKETGKSPLAQSDTGKPKVTSIFSTFKSDSTTGSSLLTKPDPASLMVNPFITSTVSLAKKEANPFLPSNGPVPISSSNTRDQEEQEEESDEPPKVEFTPHQEEGSVYSTRCKVFVKKDSNYIERGTGTLFIKKATEEKYQVIVRAENALGKILLNVLLSSSVPLKRMGKNNVMLVCLPTPEEPPPPTMVLLRVKTSDDADHLLEKLNEHQH